MSYRDEPLGLEARWTIEESDLKDGARAVPGALLALARMPIAFFIAFGGLKLADPGVGVASALGASALMALGWFGINIGNRDAHLRAMAKLSVEERTVHLRIDDERWARETAHGAAQQFPRIDISHGKMAAKGALIEVAGQTHFVPKRAMLGNEQVWEAFVTKLPPFSRNLRFTIGAWMLASAFAMSRLK